MMLKMFLFCLLFLQGCSFKSKIPLTKSPCIDGTIINIEKAGCEMIYVGIDPVVESMKIRCTLAKEQNWWTSVSFYTMKAKRNKLSKRWVLFCKDRTVIMFIAPPFNRKDKDYESWR